MAGTAITDGELAYQPAFLDREEAATLEDTLARTLAFQTHVIRIFGRSIPSPRLSAWYGDPEARYSYSGLSLEPLPWTAELEGLRARVEAGSESRFNGVLVNLYRNGQDSMGWHSDDERELGPAPVIASVSLGAVRRFVLRHKKKRAEAIAMELGHGSLLVMRGETQRYWKHALPRQPSVTTRRINLTFRLIVGEKP